MAVSKPGGGSWAPAHHQDEHDLCSLERPPAVRDRQEDQTMRQNRRKRLNCRGFFRAFRVAQTSSAKTPESQWRLARVMSRLGPGKVFQAAPDPGAAAGGRGKEGANEKVRLRPTHGRVVCGDHSAGVERDAESRRGSSPWRPRLRRRRCRGSLLVSVPLRLPLSGLFPATRGGVFAASLRPAGPSAAVSTAVLVFLPGLPDILPVCQGVPGGVAPGRPANESAASDRGSPLRVGYWRPAAPGRPGRDGRQVNTNEVTGSCPLPRG